MGSVGHRQLMSGVMQLLLNVSKLPGPGGSLLRVDLPGIPCPSAVYNPGADLSGRSRCVARPAWPHEEPQMYSPLVFVGFNDALYGSVDSFDDIIHTDRPAEFLDKI